MLKNGLRIIVVPMKDSLTATVLVLVEAGSHYEKKEENGISHFLEHMCFKGTTKRPSPLAVSQELDALGAQSNAFTGYECTGYYAKARAKHFGRILDIIADIYLHPTVPGDELQKEKGVIVEEINMYKDLPMREIYRLLDKTLYGDQPAGRSVLGTKKIIRAMKRETFLDYRKAHYTPKATTVVVAGNVQPEEAFKKVEGYFGTLLKSHKPKKPRVRDTQRGLNIGVEHKKSDQAHFQLGFRSVPAGHKDIYAIEVLRSVLGMGMSSRLFKKLRDEMGVCYYVRAESDYHSGHGTFSVASGVDNSRIGKVLDAISLELKVLKKTLVPATELEKAKECLLGPLITGLESSDEITQYFGFQEILHQKLMAPREYVEKIKKVTAAQVQKAAQKLFRDNNANFAIIGPFNNSAPFKKHIRL